MDETKENSGSEILFLIKRIANAEQLVTPAGLVSRLPLFIFVYRGS